MNDSKPRLIVIVGPTAVGKTEVAIKIAREWGAEIISADSMQVYRFMDIGTAKPSAEERSLVPHHLLDVVNPDAQFNAAIFIELANNVVRKLYGLKKPVFVVGGTGLYVKALLGGLFQGPNANDELRKFYKQELRQFGKEYLYEKLKMKDEKAASQIDKNDVVRIIRALEVLDLCGESIVEKQKVHNFSCNLYDSIKIGLTVDRSSLYEKIDQRSDKMIRDGLVGEVEGLIAAGYEETLKPMQALGYKHIVRYLKGTCSIEEAVGLIKRDTRHYAKRQMTWFGADKEIVWNSPSDVDDIRKKIGQFLRQ